MRQDRVTKAADLLQMLLTTAQGWTLILIFIGLAGLIVLRPNVRWVLLSALFWVPTFGFVADETRMFVGNVLPFPLEQIRQFREPICIGLYLLLIFAHAVRPNKSPQSPGVFAGSILFFIMHLYMISRMVLVGVTGQAFLYLILHVLAFVVIAVIVARWVAEEGHVRNLMLALLGYSALFVGGNVYFILAQTGTALGGSRLVGTADNANATSQYVGLIIPVTLYMLMSKSVSYRLKLGLYVLLGFQLIMLFATGSRTGIAVAAIAVLLLFRARLGKLFFAGIGGVLAVMLAGVIFGEAIDPIQAFERFQDGEITRGHIWLGMWHTFLENPLLGDTDFRSFGGYPENSYLAIAAYFGIIAVLLMFTMIGVFVYTAIRTTLLTRSLKMSPEWQRLSDLVVAGFFSQLAGFMYEALLLSNLAPGLLMIYAYGIMLAVLSQAVAAHAGWRRGEVPGRLPPNLAAAQ